MRWMRSLRLVLLVPALAVTACGTESPCPPPEVAGTDTVYVVVQGWHVEVGLPAGELRGPLGIYRDIFPGAATIMFGYGKRTFMIAPPESVGEYILGPVPGPSAIEVTGLKTAPADAYAPSETLTLSVPPGGATALSDFIWNDLDKDKAGGPRLLAVGGDPGILFYAARSRYDLLHTCNTWAIEALAAAGLPVSDAGVVFSEQAMARIETATHGQCH